MRSPLPPLPDAARIRELERLGYDRVAQTYSEASRIGLAEQRTAFLEQAALEAGQDVLDVCCGPGWLTLQAAAAVGATGRAVGVDLSPEIIAAAKENTREAGTENASFEVMDAEELKFPEASFDRVLSSFGLIHVPDAERAVSEMARVLRPSGRVIMTVWGSPEEAVFMRLFSESLKSAAGENLPVDPSYTLRLGEPGVLEGMLDRAGFEGIVVKHMDHSFAFPEIQDGEGFWDRFTAIGGVLSALINEELPPETVQAARADFARRAAAYRQGESLSLPAGYVFATAARAEK